MAAALNNALAALTIVAILEIVDTRDGELIEDDLGRERWVPIPGSGVEAECARCGRFHEIHATVELSDGSTRVVGTGCAVKVDFAQKSRIKSEERRAKSLTKTRGLVAGLRAKLARVEADNARIEAEVDALKVPEVVDFEREPADARDTRRWLSIEGLPFPNAYWPGDRELAAETMRRHWREDARKARGWVRVGPIKDRLDAAEKRLAKLETR